MVAPRSALVKMPRRASEYFRYLKFGRARPTRAVPPCIGQRPFAPARRWHRLRLAVAVSPRASAASPTARRPLRQAQQRCCLPGGFDDRRVAIQTASGQRSADNRLRITKNRPSGAT